MSSITDSSDSEHSEHEITFTPIDPNKPSTSRQSETPKIVRKKIKCKICQKEISPSYIKLHTKLCIVKHNTH